jgi:hypothetical protein
VENVVLKCLSAFVPACGHEFYSLSRSPDCAKFSAGLMKSVGFLKFILLGCSSIKSVRFLVGCMIRSGNFLLAHNHALFIKSRSSIATSWLDSL